MKNTALIDLLYSNHKDEYEFLPSRDVLIKWFEDLFAIFFPTYLLRKDEVERLLTKNQNLFVFILEKVTKDGAKAKAHTEDFYQALTEIYLALNEDAREIYNHDPAANCLTEVINTYPGFYAISVYRVANKIARMGVPLIPRILSEYAHQKTGIDIHPEAKIGVPFFIDHGTGIVIGETCEIGKHVKVYQGVTLGALQVTKSLADKKRHPTIEDNVIIYANATILGGDTVVGNNSVIGGNVFLTESVNPYSIVFHTNNITVKDRKSNDNNVINFII
ncbi:serine O-acetyltransferase [Haoranjiania flava]|uniref:Serine acetyltransferase n=1 Tax=Haoranjiania flava TaxID=1856322 RepID=A0AAE3LRH1_9BACT|nr:serine acetyltransferase [Haoranjiania flava]MCU7695445.1 serine acetyltransferase [Haoranjiania flava]